MAETGVPAEHLPMLRQWLTDQVAFAPEAGTPGEPGERTAERRFEEALDRAGVSLSPSLREQLRKEILAEVLGMGPIQPLLDDPSVSEVMVNGPTKVFVERAGQLTRTTITFPDDAAVLRLVDRIILPLGRASTLTVRRWMPGFPTDPG